MEKLINNSGKVLRCSDCDAEIQEGEWYYINKNDEDKLYCAVCGDEIEKEAYGEMVENQEFKYGEPRE